MKRKQNKMIRLLPSMIPRRVLVGPQPLMDTAVILRRFSANSNQRALFGATTTAAVNFQQGLVRPKQQHQTTIYRDALNTALIVPPGTQVAHLRTLRIGGKKKRNEDDENDGIVRRGPGGPQQEEEESTALSDATRARLSRLGILGSGLIFLAGKTKYVLVALKMTKMTSIFSLLASTAAYGMVYGLPFGIGIVGMLLVHESGHAAMMLRLGIPITPMLFVPFMGAVVGMKEHPKSAYEHALVALAGPVVGSAAGLAVATAGIALDSQFLMALGDFGLWINLFNLLPIGGLDGGVVAGSLNRWFLVGGLATGGALIYTGAIVNPMFYLIMFAAGYSTFTRFSSAHQGGPHENYYEIPRNKKIVIGSAYLGLIAALIAAMNWNNHYRKSPAQLRAEKAQREGRDRHGPSKEEPSLEDRLIGWSTEYQDPEYYNKGHPQSQDLYQNDPYFNGKQGGVWK